MEKSHFVLKQDIYRENRGGYAHFLNIFCESCGAQVALYQKDGPGELRRMYMDRILAPHVAYSPKADFACYVCKKVLGTFYLYEKEKRETVRLYQGSVIKKVGIGVYPLQKR